MFNSFIVKLTNSCNLACPYCYYMSDAPKKGQLIWDDVLTSLFSGIAEHCSTDRLLQFYWHGGEPLLIGIDRFRGIIEEQKYVLADHFVGNGIQTNAITLNGKWVELFKQHRVDLGISLDGTRKNHDLFRIDHSGRGTYNRVVARSQLAINAELDPMCVVVVNENEDGAATLDNVVSIGFKRVNFLLPMINWDSYDEKTAIRRGDYLIDAYRAWLRLGNPKVYVRIFNDMIHAVTARIPSYCMFHNSCAGIITIEPNGDVGLCDDLKPVGAKVYRTGLNILHHDLPSIKKKVDERFGHHQINSARSAIRPDDLVANWCPATRYSSTSGFKQRSADSIPMKMLQDEVMSSLELAGVDSFELHPQMAR